MGRCVVSCALRVQMEGSVRACPRSGHRPRLPRRDAPGRGSEARALLLDVRTKVLLHGTYAADSRRGDETEIRGVPEGWRALRAGRGQGVTAGFTAEDAERAEFVNLCTQIGFAALTGATAIERVRAAREQSG